MKWILSLSFIILFASVALADAGYREVHAGNKAYSRGDFSGAVSQYEKASEKNPGQAIIDYDLGTAQYKAGDYQKAVESLQKGLLVDDEKAALRVHYNLGNALYQAGISEESKDIQAAIVSLEKALAEYDKVLVKDAKDEDAKANQAFVKSELERLQKKQQEQQQQQNQKNQQQDGQQKKDRQQGEADQKKEESSSKEDSQKSSADQQNSPGSQESKKEDQGGDEKKQESQNGQQGQSTPAPQAPDQDKSGSSSGQASDGQIVSQKQAEVLLNDFDQNEQPKGLLKFIKPTGAERPVEKDW